MMKRYVVVLFVLIQCSPVFGGSRQTIQTVQKSLPLDGVPRVTMKTRTNSLYLHDRIIIKMMPRVAHALSKSAFGVSSIDQALSRVSVVSTAGMFPATTFKTDNESEDLSLFYFVTFSSPNDPFTLAEELSKLPEVQYAEPWFIYPLSKEIQTAPNDPFYSQQWALATIKAEKAWEVAKGDSTVIIAIVDSGVEWRHPDLLANIWTNPKEIPGNGIDDDGNGKIDDVHGWDFVGADYRNFVEDNDPTPTADNNNHGTHVAGIAAGVTNNGIGIASISYNCKILPVKCSADNDTRGDFGTAYILTGYQGIVYAAQMGATVINCSWGGLGGSQAEQDIINIVTKQGSLVVAAAGNNASDAFFSPAAYKNVLAVAATDQNDLKASFSNYGDFVDVCAPGVDIYSTIFRSSSFPSGYTIFSGTSMSSPLTAGLVALVKSTPAFKNYNALQLGEQVRVTCDNIDGVNGFYAGKLGRGRINAFNAVTVTNLPSVRMQSFSITDSPGGNGNGVPQPAETLSIRCSFKNFLTPTSSSAHVELTSLNSYISVTSGSSPLGVVNTLDSANNNATPFRVYVNPQIPASYNALMQVRVIDGSFTDSQTFSFLVNPTYRTTNVNAIQLTLTNNGKLGFFDFPKNSLGDGLIFNGVNHLFEGGLIIGTSSANVVDVVREPGGAQDGDFSSSNFYSLTSPGILSQQDGFTTFTDAGASSANRVGVQVTMYSYAFTKPEDSKYVILRYDIKNTTSSPLTNLYAGIFLDWDIGAATANYSRYDAARSLGYAYDSGTGARKEYLGIRALDSAGSYRSIVNDNSVDLSRTAKWGWLSGGFGNANAGPADIHHVISSGPYTLGVGATHTIGFALVVGDSSLANIQTNADAAKVKWVALRKANFLPVSVSEEGSGLPRTFSLSQNYPNPFNPSTSFELRVAGYEFVSLKIYDLLGREVAVLINERKSPGTYKITWNASHLPSGVYLYRMTAGGFVETKKLVLIK